MKKYLILIFGIILIFIGVFTFGMSLPLMLEGNLTSMYFGFVLIILGVLLVASWFIGKLRGKW